MRSRILALFLLCSLLVGGAATAPVIPVEANACLAASPVAISGTPGVAAFPVTITDDVGRQVVLQEAPQRIVSIAPSNTEILFALGLGEKVVAVDQYSDYPPEAEQKPQLGSYVKPDLEQIVAAAPDLVLATGVHEETVVPQLEALRLTVAVIDPEDLDDVFDGIGLVGRITGQDARATGLVCELLDRVDAVAERINGAPRPRVFFELSPELHTAGPDSFIDDLISRAGGENIAAGATEEWPQLSAEVLLEQDPEVILLADEAAGVSPDQVRTRPGWQQVTAVEQDRIVAIDPDLTNRPGPRVVDGLEAIARALHPERFP
ncbi:MAG: ABC transporter substrate-binding protein [Chloroflexota bacterium]|nr:ABC transporter substrate-binding protein [Chloroflexota bacterium]